MVTTMGLAVVQRRRHIQHGLREVNLALRQIVGLRKVFSHALIILLFAAPAFAQVEVVAAVKADLQARGVSLAESCGAFQITKRVAWTLRAQGAGVLDKPAGNQ